MLTTHHECAHVLYTHRYTQLHTLTHQDNLFKNPLPNNYLPTTVSSGHQQFRRVKCQTCEDRRLVSEPEMTKENNHSPPFLVHNRFK